MSVKVIHHPHSYVEIRVDPNCRWCSKTIKQEKTVCEKCEKWAEDKERGHRWWNQRYAKTEVLSIGAADIVRSKFSTRTIADDFEFKVDESEQMYLGVWHERREHAGYAQTRTGRHVSLHETFDVFVQFTLAQTSDGKFKDHEQAFARFFGGAIKVARAAGLIPRQTRTETQPRATSKRRVTKSKPAPRPAFKDDPMLPWRDRVLRFMRESRSYDASELLTAFQLHKGRRGGLFATLSRMTAVGDIERIGRGSYQLRQNVSDR